MIIFEITKHFGKLNLSIKKIMIMRSRLFYKFDEHFSIRIFKLEY